MENHESDKPFWVDNVRVPDKDGRIKGHSLTKYEGRIKVSIGKPKIDSMRKWRMEFKTVLPDYVHAKLNGLAIERMRGGFDIEPTTNKYFNMSKTLLAYSLEALVDRYESIVDDFMFVMNDERVPKEKTIFVKWDRSVRGDMKSSGNSAKMGKAVRMDFNFFVGYYNGRTIFDIDHKGFNSSYDPEVSKYNRIPWTQEREEFFDRIYDNFEKMCDNLDEFFEGLKPDTIDAQLTKFKQLM